MKNVLGVYLRHEISDNLLRFKPFNYSCKRTFFPKKISLLHAELMPLPNLHMPAICKLGKGIN